MNKKCKFTLQKSQQWHKFSFIESLLKISHILHTDNVGRILIWINCHLNDLSAFRLIFQLFNAHEKKHERAHPIKYKVLNHYWLHFVPPIYCLCLHDNVMKCECVMPWNMQTVNERQARVTFNFFSFSMFFCAGTAENKLEITPLTALVDLFAERNEICKYLANIFFYWREKSVL